MHRMHRLGLKAVLTASIFAGLATTAPAALLRPNDTREYPDITAFANGFQAYTYDARSKTGTFQLSNIPFLLTNGQSPDGGFLESNVTPTTDGAGLRTQSLTAVLDSSGNLIASPLNSYQMYGTVTVGNKTYTGLLLSGTPTAFGSQTLKPAVGNEDLFDLSLKITGGSLASLYGPDAYIRVTSEANSNFNGVFTTDFSSEKVLTNTHMISSLVPSPVPEPTALVVLLACGAGLLYRGRRRIDKSDLGV